MVEESSSTKDITIMLQIKKVYYPVTEQTPIMVIWSRGKRMTQTKKQRLLNEHIFEATFNETFQINTAMEVDENGAPTTKKSSKLTVVSKKLRTTCGEAELNLADFGTDSEKVIKLPLMLKGEPIQEAWIEVGMKGKITPGAP